MAAKKPSWDAIRAAYKAEIADTGTIDLIRLAKIHKVNYGTLRNRVSEGGWREEAEVLRTEVVKRTAELAVPVIVRHRIDVMDKHLTFLGQLRQAALTQLGEAARDKTLTVPQAMKIVFDSLRAEKMLQDMVSDGPTRDMTEDDLRQAMFDRFVEKFALAAAEEPPAAPVPVQN